LPSPQPNEGPRLDPPLEGLENDKGEGIERDNDKAADDGALEEGVPSFTSDEGVEAGSRGFVLT
jgi:hypothetical protein